MSVGLFATKSQTRSCTQRTVTARVAAPQTGTAFKAFAGIERKKLAITTGHDTLSIVGEENENHTRCGVCGSLLFSVVRDGAFVHVAMGSLVDAPSIRPTQNIFVGSRAPWFEITDALPQREKQLMTASP